MPGTDSAKLDLTISEVLDAIDESFVAFDRDWRFTHLNRAALQVFQRASNSERSLIGQQLWDAFPALLGTSLEAKYRNAMDASGPLAFEALRRCPAVGLRFAPSRPRAGSRFSRAT